MKFDPRLKQSSFSLHQTPSNCTPLHNISKTQCGYCSYLFESRNKLFEHMRSMGVHDIKPYHPKHHKNKNSFSKFVKKFGKLLLIDKHNKHVMRQKGG